MSNKGYQLADGTWSTEYKVGDKFEVTRNTDAFSTGSTISFYVDDESLSPWFLLESGECFYDDSSDSWSVPWKNLKAVNPKQKEFTKKDLKDGMWVTYRKGAERVLISGKLCEQGRDKFVRSGGISDYNPDLTLSGYPNLDIMKVEYMGEVLWEREEQTEKQKRIKELEECIAKAQEELNKMGIK